jgi:hypothetical protein
LTQALIRCQVLESRIFYDGVARSALATLLAAAPRGVTAPVMSVSILPAIRLPHIFSEVLRGILR